MPRGQYPYEYLNRPAIDRASERVYADIDAFTHEFFEEDTEFHSQIDFFVPLPPLYYEGRFVKGIFCSQAVDLLLKLYPRLAQLFFSLAFSMCGAYPRSESADGYFTLYNNPHREAWFRGRHPERCRKHFIPLQDADFTHDYYMAPVPVKERDIDVLCVASLYQVKNLPFLARALKVYRERYPSDPIRMTLVTGKKDLDVNFSTLDAGEKNELRQMEEVLVHLHDYIDFVGWAHQFNDLPRYYSRAKVVVLGSLAEGKNRVIQEAMCCNTPVVCCEELNWHIRGGDRLFPERAGVLARFDPELFADAIHTAMHNRDQFTPRKSYLQWSGRRRFLNTCVDRIPYYAQAIPDYVAQQAYASPWLDLATQDNYQLSLHDFLYGRNTAIQYPKGLAQIAETVRFYFARFGIPFSEQSAATTTS